MRATLRGVTIRSLFAALCGSCVFALSFFGLQTAGAQNGSQYHSCNGIYTNKPCEEVEADLESPLKAPPPEKAAAIPSPKVQKPTAVPTGKDQPVLPVPTPTMGTPTVRKSPAPLPSPPVEPSPSSQSSPSQVSPSQVSPSPSPSPSPKVDAKATAISKSKKDSALHNLRMKLLKGKKSVGVDLDISSAVDVCTSRSTSLEECRTVVASLDATLEERITTARLTKVAEDKAKVEATTAAKAQQNQSTVVIVQPNVRATATPFFIFDTGPLLPVDPSYRRPSHGGPHHGERPRPHLPPSAVPPAPAGGTLVDTVPRKK